MRSNRRLFETNMNVANRLSHYKARVYRTSTWFFFFLFDT